MWRKWGSMIVKVAQVEVRQRNSSFWLFYPNENERQEGYKALLYIQDQFTPDYSTSHAIFACNFAFN